MIGPGELANAFKVVKDLKMSSWELSGCKGGCVLILFASLMGAVHPRGVSHHADPCLILL